MKTKLVEIGVIPSINYHLWKSCNFKCKFCFGAFNDVPNNNLHEKQAINLLKRLVDFGFEKITFSGGEPTLCAFLPKLLKVAKNGGMTTMIVTNGSKLSEEWLESNRDNLDWIAISIDSTNIRTNYISGRCHGNKPFDETIYLSLIAQIKQFGYKIKVNTVVSQFNQFEDMNAFIEKIKPERWKILQALPIIGQNDSFIKDFSISFDEFNEFIKRHEKSSLIKETNYDMKGSYVMIDPIGRFFNNSNGQYSYSSPINEVGVERALKEINYCFNKFISRDGLYDWK
jgi:radical S-adenosyl methionine domain-containing protein 2